MVSRIPFFCVRIGVPRVHRTLGEGPWQREQLMADLHKLDGEPVVLFWQRPAVLTLITLALCAAFIFSLELTLFVRPPPRPPSLCCFSFYIIVV